MCGMYWNLNTKIKCPACGKTTLWNLQTHFMGDLGSCGHNYKLNQKIHELKGVNVVLDGRIDDFIGDCEKCERLFDVGAEIVKGKVVKVWILKEVKPQAIIIKGESYGSI